jgi:hypothetical protein
VRTVLLAAAVTIMLAGCGGAGATERPLERVRIVARERPTRPSCQASRGCERPYRGRFDLITADGHRSRIATDARGWAVVDVPSGTYRIATDRDRLLPRLTGAIEAGKTVDAVHGDVVLLVRTVAAQRVTLVFDTGIR